VLGAQGIDRGLIERSDADPVDRGRFLDRRADGAGQLRLAALHLDDDPRAVFRQHRIERRHANALAAKRVRAVAGEVIAGVDARQLAGGERIDRTLPIGGAVERAIVDDDGDAVARQLDVDLEAVGAERKTVVERRHGIFRGQQRAAAMRKHQRSVGSKYRRTRHEPQITPGPQNAQNSLQSGS
jgi:hypothetical protein